MTEREDEAAADAARREELLLAHPDGLAYPVWAELVRWAAPGPARGNPKLLAEAVVRRGLKRAAEQSGLNEFGVSPAESVAALFGELGLAVCVREG